MKSPPKLVSFLQPQNPPFLPAYGLVTHNIKAIDFRKASLITWVTCGDKNNLPHTRDHLLPAMSQQRQELENGAECTNKHFQRVVLRSRTSPSTSYHGLFRRRAVSCTRLSLSFSNINYNDLMFTLKSLYCNDSSFAYRKSKSSSYTHPRL